MYLQYVMMSLYSEYQFVCHATSHSGDGLH